MNRARVPWQERSSRLSTVLPGLVEYSPHDLKSKKHCWSHKTSILKHASWLISTPPVPRCFKMESLKNYLLSPRCSTKQNCWISGIPVFRSSGVFNNVAWATWQWLSLLTWYEAHRGKCHTKVHLPGDWLNFLWSETFPTYPTLLTLLCPIVQQRYKCVYMWTQPQVCLPP